MGLPHLFTIKKFKDFDELENTFIRLFEFCQSNPTKVFEKLDGTSHSFKLKNNEIVYLNKNKETQSLFSLSQDKVFENIKRKKIKILKTLQTIGWKEVFQKLELENENNFINFEYISGKQNIIEYSQEAIILNYCMNENKIITLASSDARLEPLRYKQSFNFENSWGYYPTNHIVRGQKVAHITEGFDLPGHPWIGGSGGDLSKSKLREILTSETTEERKFLNTYIQFANELISKLNFVENFSENKEGIVVYDFEDLPPFKVVGDFMIKNIEEENKFGVFFFLMAGMKPPHVGHIKLLKEIVKKASGYNTKPKLFLTDAKRSGFGLMESRKVLDIFLKNEQIYEKLDIIESEDNNNFEKMENFILETGVGSTILLCSSEHDKEKVNEIIKYLKNKHQDKIFEIFVVQEKLEEWNNKKFSATDMRNAVIQGEYERFLDFIPENSKKDADLVWDILRNKDLIEYSTSESIYKMPKILVG